MDDSAQKAAPSATEKPDNEDDKNEDADTVMDARASTIRTLLEPFCSRGEKVSKGGFYEWTVVKKGSGGILLGSRIW